jgi:hypothetical protein
MLISMMRDRAVDKSERVGDELAAAGENADRDRQVEPSGLLGEVGGGEVSLRKA